MTRPFRHLLVVLALALGLACALAGPARADYGSWFPSPGSFGSECSASGRGACTSKSAYEAAPMTFDDPQVAQISNFTCTFYNGMPIGPGQQALLTIIFGDADQAYNGTLKDSNGDLSGYAKDGGAKGMDEYLSQAKMMLQAGMYPAQGWQNQSTFTDWFPWSSANAKAAKNADAIKAYTDDFQAWNSLSPTRQASAAGQALKAKLQQDEKVLGLTSIDGSTTADGAYVLDPTLADYINGQPIGQGGVNSPVNLAAGYPAGAQGAPGTTVNGVVTIVPEVPEGCGLNPIQVDNIHFLDIITNTGGFFTDLLLYIPSHVAAESYNFLQPYAFLYTFWTPHTERGDTMFNISMNCNTVGANTQQNASVADTCYDGQPLGFSIERSCAAQTASTCQEKQKGWYLSVAIFLQWLVSGFYFVILFTAAIVYMVRGQKSAQFNVLQMIPKLILSVLLTMFGIDIIGLLVSASNMVVTTLFGFDQARSVGRITDILGQTGTYLSSAGSFIASLSNCVFGLWAVFFFAFFVITSLLRQLMLMALICLMPLACFCLIVPRWQGQFNKYMKALLAVIFVPAAMAFVFKLGIALNPIVNAADAGQDVGVGVGFLGLVMLMATMWMMAKVVKIGAAAATGNQALMGSLTGKALGKVGMMTAMAGVSVGGPAGFALRGMGAGMQIGSKASAAGESMGASLIPGGGGGGGGGGLPGLGGGGRRLGLGAGGGGGSKSGVGLFGGQKRSLEDRFGSYLEMRQTKHGERRVSGRQAQSMKMREKEALADHLSQAQGQQGGKMTAAQIRLAKDEFYNGALKHKADGSLALDEHDKPIREENAEGWYSTHGKLKKRGGSYVLKTPKDQLSTPTQRGAYARDGARLALGAATLTGRGAQAGAKAVARPVGRVAGELADEWKKGPSFSEGWNDSLLGEKVNATARGAANLTRAIGSDLHGRWEDSTVQRTISSAAARGRSVGGGAAGGVAGAAVGVGHIGKDIWQESEDFRQWAGTPIRAAAVKAKPIIENAPEKIRAAKLERKYGKWAGPDAHEPGATRREPSSVRARIDAEMAEEERLRDAVDLL